MFQRSLKSFATADIGFVVIPCPTMAIDMVTYVPRSPQGEYICYQLRKRFLPYLTITLSKSIGKPKSLLPNVELQWLWLQRKYRKGKREIEPIDRRAQYRISWQDWHEFCAEGANRLEEMNAEIEEKEAEIRARLRVLSKLEAHQTEFPSATGSAWRPYLNLRGRGLPPGTGDRQNGLYQQQHDDFEDKRDSQLCERVGD